MGLDILCSSDVRVLARRPPSLSLSQSYTSVRCDEKDHATNIGKLFVLCVGPAERHNNTRTEGSDLRSRPAVLPRIDLRSRVSGSSSEPSFVLTLLPFPGLRATECVGDRFSHTGERSIRFCLAEGKTFGVCVHTQLKGAQCTQ